MIYDLNGASLSEAYDIDSLSLNGAYDVNGNVVFSKNRYETFSVLSDSYGAIEGGVTPSTNAVYYPSGDVTQASQMWWYLFGQSYGCTLARNNSYSGSRIANDPNWYAGIENSFIGRANNIGNPDFIIVLGGTNDVWNSIALGDYVYSDWTSSDLETFRSGLAYLFDYLNQTYDADILFLCNNVAFRTNQSTWPTQYEYYVSAHTICEHMNVPILDIYPEVSGNHPTYEGMKYIRNSIMIFLGEQPTVLRNLTVSLVFPKTLDWNPNHGQFIVDEITENMLYRVTVTVTAVGGQDTYVEMSASGDGGTASFASFSADAGQLGTFSMIIQANHYHAGTNVTMSVYAQGTTRTAIISNLTIEEVTY